MTTFEFLRREPEIRDYKKGQTVFKQGDPGSDSCSEWSRVPSTYKSALKRSSMYTRRTSSARWRSRPAAAQCHGDCGRRQPHRGDQQEALPPPRRSDSALCAQHDAGDHRAPAPRQRVLEPKLSVNTTHGVCRNEPMSMYDEVYCYAALPDGHNPPWHLFPDEMFSRSLHVPIKLHRPGTLLRIGHPQHQAPRDRPAGRQGVSNPCYGIAGCSRGGSL